MAIKHAVGGKVLQVIITLLGAGFILQAVISLTLGQIGERGTAAVTHIRRELGERNETTPNRYTFILAYTFQTPDGRTITDSTRRIGGPLYVKATGRQTVPVRYLKAFPMVNTLEENARPSWGKAASLAVGALLIFAANRPRRKVKIIGTEAPDKTMPASAALPAAGGVASGTIGYSAKIDHPAFACYINNANRWSLLFAVILAAAAVAGFYVYGETSREMANPEALYIGLGIGGMFLAIAAWQIIGRHRSKTWDGVVVDKKIERKRSRRSDEDDWRTSYTVVIRSDGGETHIIGGEDDDTLYNYYRIGDRVRHHKGLNSFEKYDKSQDTVIFCNACASLNDIRDDRCFRCKCPLLK
ncbi:hypothetical protein [Anaeroselena agilis]|uniref:DUF3592 domain-containing protein n=1 Tax=Anaeroselena agilis TaxID=3063788 RepID=A0ABU3P3C1_9FIRM|nr:hypothetical protein [Selenomonadales bacterium 4137-cl]